MLVGRMVMVELLLFACPFPNGHSSAFADGSKVEPGYRAEGEFFATPQQACDDFVKRRVPGGKSVGTAKEEGEGQFRCFWKEENGYNNDMSKVSRECPSDSQVVGKQCECLAEYTVQAGKCVKTKDDSPKSDAPPRGAGCDVTEDLLLEMWQVNDAARKASKSKLPPATKTFAVAYVMDGKCQFVTKVQGEFQTTGGKHAERQVLDQLATGTPLGKQLQKGFTVFWMIDQVPCNKPQPPPPPAGGYCTKGLKDFARHKKIGQRVFVVASPDKSRPSPKQFAVRGKAPTQDNYFELTEFTVNP